MEKSWDPQKFENEIYEKWLAQNSFAPKIPKQVRNDKGESFTIAIPPPNVTGTLHLGHAAFITIQDILTRWNRMKKKSALWVPGTDHAAIATENVVLKNLNEKSREEFSRENFLEKCWEWSKKSHATISNQIAKMGASVDWSREAFTFDAQRNFAVNFIFKKLWDKKLIARENRMINWSVGAQSVLADDEVEHEETDGALYFFKYFLAEKNSAGKKFDENLKLGNSAGEIQNKNSAGKNSAEKISTEKIQNKNLTEKNFTENLKLENENSGAEFLIVATTRPETMFGDAAVAVNPDEKYIEIKIGKNGKNSHDENGLPQYENIII
jgi:valyl-tRNA synthetase